MKYKMQLVVIYVTKQLTAKIMTYVFIGVAAMVFIQNILTLCLYCTSTSIAVTAGFFQNSVMFI
jgi:hypothetical protein